MRNRSIVSIALVALVAGAAGGFFLEEQSARDGARLFDQVLSLVQDRYVDSVDAGALFEKAAHGLVAELNDPYSELLSPKELKAFTTTTGGRYGGVGMLIEDQQGAIVIQRVYPNTPAERAGIREGDRIIEIESQSTRGWKTSQVSEKMQGVPGTEVRVRFARPGATVPLDVTFTRAIIRIPAVPYAIVLDGGIGYIPLQTFNETAARELGTQVARLQREGVKGLVVDLRGNQGGYLDQALDAANLFLKRGTEIASVRYRAEPNATYVADSDPVEPGIPMVILIDGYSASASEIVAGALQDHDRALVLGTTSFGKGLVQTMFPLESDWALKITTGKWYTPSGRSIHKARTLAELQEAEADTSAATEDVSKRPTFKSAGGRTIYGGGAVIPDLIVPADTITTAERVLAQKLLARQQDVYVSIYDYALTLKDAVKPGFTVEPAWRDDLLRTFRDRGVEVSRAEWDAGRAYIDRVLANRVARLAFGDSTAKRREIGDDSQLSRALELLRAARSPQELFTLAARSATPPTKN